MAPRTGDRHDSFREIVEELEGETDPADPDDGEEDIFVWALREEETSYMKTSIILYDGVKFVTMSKALIEEPYAGRTTPAADFVMEMRARFFGFLRGEQFLIRTVARKLDGYQAVLNHAADTEKDPIGKYRKEIAAILYKEEVIVYKSLADCLLFSVAFLKRCDITNIYMMGELTRLIHLTKSACHRGLNRLKALLLKDECFHEIRQHQQLPFIHDFELELLAA